MDIECSYYVKSSTLLSAGSPENSVSFNCFDQTCLYLTNNGIRTILGDLSQSKFHRCQYSTGLQSDSFSVVDCVDETNIDYLEKASDFYRTQVCSRKKCQCSNGYANFGWQCVALGVNQLRSVCFTMTSPITLTTTTNDDLKQLNNDVRRRMRGSSLLVDGISLDFSTTLTSNRGDN